MLVDTTRYLVINSHWQFFLNGMFDSVLSLNDSYPHSNKPSCREMEDMNVYMYVVIVHAKQDDRNADVSK